MSISDAQFQQWLERNQRNPRAALFELTFLGAGGSPIAGVEYHAYVSNVAYNTKPADTPANQIFDECVLEVPAFSRRMSELLSGRSTQSYGDLIIANNDGDRESWLSMNWDGRRVRMWLGDPSWAFPDFRLVLDGVIADVFDVGGGKIGFKIADKAALLNRPVMTTLLGGSGPEAGGGVMPLVLGGIAFNVTPKLLDEATHAYRFTQSGGGEIPFRDDSTAAEFVVREDGLTLFAAKTLASSDAGTDLLHVVAHGQVAGRRIQFPFNAGTDPPAPLLETTAGSPANNYWVSTDGLAADDFKVAPTLADALAGTNSINLTGAQTGTPAISTYGHTDNLDGTFTVAGNPSGLITNDANGLVATGSPAAQSLRAGDIIEQVLTSSLTNTPLTAADIDMASLAAFNALCAQTLSIYLTEQTSFAELLDRIVLSVGGWWGFSRAGLLQLGRLDIPTPGSPPAPVYSFNSDDAQLRTIRLQRRILPRAVVKLRGIYNWTQHTVVAGSLGEYAQAFLRKRELTVTGSAGVTTWDTDPENHRNALRPEPYDSLIKTTTGSTAALQAEADRLADLFQYPTAVWSFQTHQAAILLILGDLIYVEHPRFTGYGTVVGLVEKAKGRSEISFFAQMPDEYPTGDIA